MRALITGGGTGGHINPALAIASIIKKYESDSEIAFVGTPNGMENKLVPREGYKIYHIEVRGLKRRSFSDGAKYLNELNKSIHAARMIIKEFKPDVCIGTGGYVSWPLIRAAEIMFVPTVMHESNALVGKAVKTLAPRLSLLLVNFDNAREQVLCRKVIKSGNPLRSDFDSVSPEEAKKRLGIESFRYSILSCGGSLGAEPINNAILEVMSLFSGKRADVHHLHQAGSGKIDEIIAQYNEKGLDSCPNLELVPYIYDMPLRMNAADIVINRAGAMTVSELATLGKPAILIPSPYVADNHQYKNAKVLEDSGACILIEEKDLTGQRLADEIKSLLDDEERRNKMSENIKKFAVKDTESIIYNGIKSILK